MNCELFQSELLNLSDPRQLPPALQAHAKMCPLCDRLAQRMAELDRVVSRLPVPAADPQRLEEFLQTLAVEPVAVPHQPASPPGSRRSFWSLAGQLAACVLVLAGVWWAFREPTSRPAVTQLPKHELLAKQVAATVQLAQAKTAPKRLTIWVDSAHDLSTEAQQLARVASSQDLQNLSQLYESAVQNGLLKQAENLPETLSAVERNQVLNEAIRRLNQAEQESASMLAKSPPPSQAALKRISETARKGRERLQTLLQQGGA